MLVFFCCLWLQIAHKNAPSVLNDSVVSHLPTLTFHSDAIACQHHGLNGRRASCALKLQTSPAQVDFCLWQLFSQKHEPPSIKYWMFNFYSSQTCTGAGWCESLTRVFSRRHDYLLIRLVPHEYTEVPAPAGLQTWSSRNELLSSLNKYWHRMFKHYLVSFCFVAPSCSHNSWLCGNAFLQRFSHSLNASFSPTKMWLRFPLILSGEREAVLTPYLARLCK